MCDMHKCLIIAEAGVNHNGDPAMAFQLVDAAVEAGADIVKFQTFKASSLITKKAKKAKYQAQNTDSSETQYEMLKRLELPYEVHHELIEYCEKKGIEFLSTAFDSDSLKFITDDLGLSRLKVPSGELTNSPLLLQHAQVSTELIISTGMATLGEIEEALGVVAFGLLNGSQPSRLAFREAYVSREGRSILKEKVTLLHCTTEYPAPFEEINLNVMNALKQTFDLRIGYSDHSKGITVPIAAAALGAEVIEKHFTLDKNLPGPDHKASLEPNELKSMVMSIREVETALGSCVKSPTVAETRNKEIARKSLVALRPITVGEVLSPDNISVKRPGTGVSPINYWDYLGKTAIRSFEEDELIS